MFKMITWPQYLGAVTTLLVLYYLYVAATYYREELKALVSKQPAVRTPAVRPPASGLFGKGPLIPNPTVALAAPPTESTTDESEAQTSEEDSAEVQAADSPAEVPATNAEEEREEEYTVIDINAITVDSNEKSIKFTKTEEPTATEVVQDDLEQDFTVGVAQLNDYLEQAADGEITQEELVREMPALVNTELLAAFYKTSNQNSQQITAALFADMTTE